jgi:hypothetical protein
LRVRDVAGVDGGLPDRDLDRLLVHAAEGLPAVVPGERGDARVRVVRPRQLADAGFALESGDRLSRAFGDLADVGAALVDGRRDGAGVRTDARLAGILGGLGGLAARGDERVVGRTRRRDRRGLFGLRSVVVAPERDQDRDQRDDAGEGVEREVPLKVAGETFDGGTVRIHAREGSVDLA